MTDLSSPWNLAATGAFLSGLSGVAAILADSLRTKKRLTILAVCSASLSNGLLGAGLALIWYSYFRTNVYMLMGLTVLIGLMGDKAVPFAIDVMKTIVKSLASKIRNGNES